jgi:putative glutamine amidotransferase
VREVQRPVVGVTGPDRGGFAAWIMTALALWRSGATPVRVTPRRDVDDDRFDALVIGGGTDVHPSHYGMDAEPREARRRRVSLLDWTVGLALSALRALFARRDLPYYDLDRDALEKRLIRHALIYELPILGICRGAQLMNVELGGSLYKEITQFYNEETGNVRSILPRKEVRVLPGTRLRDILARDHCRVNALHDQSVRELGDGVALAAVESSGVIQAIEHPEHPLFIGVQWHPEYMPQSRTQQGLFSALVQKALQRRR